jgi:hypothetical protein
MTTRHTATAPDGTVLRRTSQNKVYPFCVAAYIPAAVARRYAERDAAEYRGMAARHQAAIDNGGVDERRSHRYSIEQWEQWRDDAIVRAERAERAAAAAADGEWFAHGWASRLDLAEKRANEARNRGWVAEILPTEQVTK